MILAIYQGKTLFELQEKFNECFPNFKLEFYAHPHHSWKPSAHPPARIDGANTVGDVSHSNENGLLEIKSWYPVGRVEEDFSRLFGLNVQIFRNENGVWQATRPSDPLLQTGPQPHMNQPMDPPGEDDRWLEESFQESD